MIEWAIVLGDKISILPILVELTLPDHEIAAERIASFLYSNRVRWRVCLPEHSVHRQVLEIKFPGTEQYTRPM
jgi:hypothetical protein